MLIYRVVLLAGAGLIAGAIAACSSNKWRFDAEGVFEADEVIVSSEVGGKLLTLSVEEGSVLAKDSPVAVIDSLPLRLQKQQVEATISSLR